MYSYQNTLSGGRNSTDSYHNNFSPNWICRDVVDVDVITPAVGAGPEVAEVKTTVFGVPKFG